jgi:hypothetical protein
VKRTITNPPNGNGLIAKTRMTELPEKGEEVPALKHPVPDSSYLVMESRLPAQDQARSKRRVMKRRDRIGSVKYLIRITAFVEFYIISFTSILEKTIYLYSPCCLFYLGVFILKRGFGK